MQVTITKITDHEQKLEFQAVPPYYLPFYCEDYENAYYFYKAFDFDPFNIWALTCSGSPVVLTENLFVGFLNETGGRFSYDGKDKLTVTVPAGQEVYVAMGNPYEAWNAYNELLYSRFNDPVYEEQNFWKGMEYCTWVDQKAYGRTALPPETKERGFRAINEKYVYDYMRRLEEMKLPTGKITIDEGWDDLGFDRSETLIQGNFEIDRVRFPHFEKLIEDIKKEGFLPSLWFSPFIATPNSKLGQTHPELLGVEMYRKGDPIHHRKFVKDSEYLNEHFANLFRPYVEMGVRKFKCDLSYGPKSEMKLLAKRAYEVVKKMDPTIEVEMHMPDIFISRYADTVRTNDVCFEHGDWRACTFEHYRVCAHSTNKILNVDHVGTNSEVPPEDFFMEHARMLFALKGGYPCISYLPDRLQPAYKEELIELTKNWKYSER